jgi:glycolate oxidase iron-sulfur subunit
MFRNDPLAADAATVAGLAKDISEVLAEAGPARRRAQGAAGGLSRRLFSLQHGQQIKSAPKDLLKRAGFEVVEPADSHLCCGSAGTYNLLQPEISAELKRRKVATLEAKAPQVIAAGNIGCMMQIGSGTDGPGGAYGGTAGLGHRRAEGRGRWPIGSLRHKSARIRS